MRKREQLPNRALLRSIRIQPSFLASTRDLQCFYGNRTHFSKKSLRACVCNGTCSERYWPLGQSPASLKFPWVWVGLEEEGWVSEDVLVHSNLDRCGMGEVAGTTRDRERVRARGSSGRDCGR